VYVSQVQIFEHFTIGKEQNKCLRPVYDDCHWQSLELWDAGYA